MTAAGMVFTGALAVVFYAYAGYPALVLLAARLRPAPVVRKRAVTPPLTVVVAARDEEACIRAKLENCLALEYPRDRIEVLVVSDGSTDRTEVVVESFAHLGVRLVRLRPARGKAFAINTAVAAASGEVLLFTDARQHLEPRAACALVACLADPAVGAVSGELHLRRPATTSPSAGVAAYWSLEKSLRRAESRLDSTVGVTGAIYALRRELFRPLDPRTVLDDVAIPMEVVMAGRRVVFEPAAAAWDSLSADPLHEFRRKVRTLAGNYQLVRLRPALVDPRRNRLLWQFASHKLARLAVPWCLLALLLSSGVLASRSLPAQAALALQLVFYLSAALAIVARGRSRPGWLSRGLAIPSSFVLLNVAAAAALLEALRGRTSAGWKEARR
ncbi:MAG TPA: glycosyltransferase family 2 protein [Vicinamibacteria bacterium]|nr:glycosyltransferase family 2 protein [Vicinamibacteria bacterium]